MSADAQTHHTLSAQRGEGIPRHTLVSNKMQIASARARRKHLLSTGCALLAQKQSIFQLFAASQTSAFTPDDDTYVLLASNSVGFKSQHCPCIGQGSNTPRFLVHVQVKISCSLFSPPLDHVDRVVPTKAFKASQSISGPVATMCS